MNDHIYIIVKYLFGISLILLLAATRLNGHNVSRDLPTNPYTVTAIPVDSFSTNKNYVIERIYTAASASNPNAKFIENVNYLDGFGRKTQEIQVLASPGGNADIIIPHVYGMHGKEEKKYLPYSRAGNTGVYDVNAMNSTNWNIYGSLEAPYTFSKIVYDDSPLDRVIKTIGPGKSWHTLDKGCETTYGTNVSGEVLLFRVANNGTLTCDNKTYDAGSLRKTTVSDEDGCIVKEFSDRQDRTILMTNFDGNEWLETYHVYDKRGLLRFVLPPEASSRLKSSITQTILNQYAYYYEYDASERLIQKRLPGCDPVYLVYDSRNRLVLSQDGKQRAENTNTWSYSLYDEQNRVSETGEIVLTGTVNTHSGLQTAASASDNYIPTGSRVAFQYTLYDSYTATANVPVHAFVQTAGYATGYHPHVTGLVTSVKTRVLETGTYLTTTTYYDGYCRAIQTVSDNLQGQVSRRDTKYDFTGNTVGQRESHRTSTDKTDMLESVNVYDDRGRLQNSTTKLNGGTPATVTCTYDAIGRLVSRKLGNITETMTYNSRGWLTGKESTPFKMKLRYEAPEDATTPARYNGNISEWEWQQGTNVALVYGFTYDKVNRLQETTQKQRNGNGWGNLTGHYLEKGITYDRNGNIKTLQRTAGGTTVDNLVYSYTGNQLTGLTENVRTTPTGDIYSPGSMAVGTYTYDKNGNMTIDSRKVLNFNYNVLNLLSEVKTGNAIKARYSYLADGTKLRVRDNGEVNGFDYLGSLTYKKSSTGLQLEAANFGGGTIRADGSNSGQYEMDYFLTDHLGSVRVIVDGTGKVLERNDYYPFGTRLVRSDYPQLAVNRYKYNGKDEQVTGDLEYLDYGARMYDSGLGKWFVVDPMLEKYLNISPYVYCINNPMKYIDPNGERINFYTQDENKKWISVRFIDAFSPGTRLLWEMFARTQIGYDFLALYAEAGQSIGGIYFKEDGPFAGVDLNIYDFDDHLGVLGAFILDLGKEKDDISFQVKMNRFYAGDKEGMADYLVALGHELFIHMEQWHKKYLSAFSQQDRRRLDDLIRVSTREGGEYDHIRYINGNESYKSFTTYLQQLKNIEKSPLNPGLIDKAKEKHDEYYEKYRKNNK